MSAGQGLACGLREDQTAVCWGPPGAGTSGELDVPGGRLLSVSAGSGQACGLRPDGTLACWGRILTKAWPKPCALSGSMAALCWDSVATRWPLPGPHYDVYVFICAAEGKYTPADLQYETDRMNDTTGAFYARESSGQAAVRFLPAAILSPRIDWDNTAISDPDSYYCEHEHGPEPGPETGGNLRPDYAALLTIIDVDPGPRGDGITRWCPGACALHDSNSDPATPGVARMPTVEALLSSRYICPSASPPRLVRDLPGSKLASPGKNTSFGNIRAGHNTSCRDLAYWVYDRLVAHELGHALFGFGHPPDCSIMSGRWECRPTRALNMDDTLRHPNMLQTSYIGCAERQQAGWPQDPNRCPHDP